MQMSFWGIKGLKYISSFLYSLLFRLVKYNIPDHVVISDNSTNLTKNRIKVIIIKVTLVDEISCLINPSK